MVILHYWDGSPKPGDPALCGFKAAERHESDNCPGCVKQHADGKCPKCVELLKARQPAKKVDKGTYWDLPVIR